MQHLAWPRKECYNLRRSHDALFGRKYCKMPILRLCIFLTVLTLATPALAVCCGGDFNSFMVSMSAEVQAAGVSPSVTSAAFGGVSEDAAMLISTVASATPSTRVLRNMSRPALTPGGSMAAG